MRIPWVPLVAWTVEPAIHRWRLQMLGRHRGHSVRGIRIEIARWKLLAWRWPARVHGLCALRSGREELWGKLTVGKLPRREGWLQGNPHHSAEPAQGTVRGWLSWLPWLLSLWCGVRLRARWTSASRASLCSAAVSLISFEHGTAARKISSVEIPGALGAQITRSRESLTM